MTQAVEITPLETYKQRLQDARHRLQDADAKVLTADANLTDAIVSGSGEIKARKALSDAQAAKAEAERTLAALESRLDDQEIEDALARYSQEIQSEVATYGPIKEQLYVALKALETVRTAAAEIQRLDTIRRDHSRRANRYQDRLCKKYTQTYELAEVLPTRPGGWYSPECVLFATRAAEAVGQDCEKLSQILLKP